MSMVTRLFWAYESRWGEGISFFFFGDFSFWSSGQQKKTGSGACYAFTDYLSLITDTLVFFIASHGVFFFFILISLLLWHQKVQKARSYRLFSIKKNKLPSNHVT